MAVDHNYYNLNELRRYPLDDASTGTDDAGTRINDAIIADCRIRWPSHLGTYAFVSGLTVTPKLVTLVILAADGVQTTEGFTPLAAVTISGEVVIGRPYPLRPLVDGVGGWVVFGSGVREATTLRFATPAQGLLAPKAARAYQLLPIDTLGKVGRSRALTGLVTIKGGNDISVVKEPVRVGDATRDALVIRLKQEPGAPNVLQKYLGPCDGRPESGTCGRPGVEYVNGVQPDCDGNLTIRIIGAETGQFDSCGGLVVDHDVNLDDVCNAATRSPRSWRDLCEDELSSGSSDSEGSLPSVESSISMSSEILPCEEFPYDEELDGAAPGFIPESGNFELTDGYAATAGYMRNLSLLYLCDVTSSLDKRVTSEFKVHADRPNRNAAIVINYHLVDPLTNPHIEYFLVMLDLNVNKIRVLRYNGTVLAQQYASPATLPLVPDAIYRLIVETQPFGSQVALNVTLVGVDDPAAVETSFSLATSRYGDDDGIFGVATDKAHATFLRFSVEDA